MHAGIATYREHRYLSGFWRMYAAVYDAIWDSPLTDGIVREVLLAAGLPAHADAKEDSRRPIAIDFGCGTGLYSSAVLEAGYHVIGIDPSEAMLQRALAAHRINWAIDPSDLDIPDHSADIVIAANVLQVCDDPTALLEEFSRLVSNNGCILCVWPERSLTLGSLLRADLSAGSSVPAAALACVLRFVVGVAGAGLGARSWSSAQVENAIDIWLERMRGGLVIRGTARGVSSYMIWKAS